MPGSNDESRDWSPVGAPERYAALDLVRGFALLGVLLVNLLYFFRLSLFAHILNFHSDPGWANHAVDLLVTEFLEFKAFDLFSLTFGIGVAVQAERASRRGVSVASFLARRFLVLLAFGLIHLVLISNVDILTLYVVCGLLLIPFLRLPVLILALAGLVAVHVPAVFPRGSWFPSVAFLQAQAENANRVYAQGSFMEILAFRWRETQDLVAPLLVASAQRTFGLMLLGAAVWRAGIIKQPHRFQRLLWSILLGAGVIGFVNTTAEVWSEASRKPNMIPSAFQSLGSHVPLALAYASGLLVWRRSQRTSSLLAPVAAMGRMALTNYLAQSMVFSLVFYGNGLFGKLSTAVTAAIGILFYMTQMVISVWWLKQYRFGPFEWIWRSLTYGRRQPMHLRSPTSSIRAS